MKPVILYEDDVLIVCHKPAGIATQTKSVAERDMVSILKNYAKSTGQTVEIYVVHRLDQPVEGVLVFAKTKEAAASLSTQAANGRMEKTYLAVIEGQMDEPAGVLEHMLLKDGRSNRSNVVPAGTKGAKKAVLSYETIESSAERSLVRVALHTGRHHQIRAQFAACGHPLAGDGKYGAKQPESRQGGIALCAASLSFVHPVSGGRKEYRADDTNIRRLL